MQAVSLTVTPESSDKHGLVQIWKQVSHKIGVAEAFFKYDCNKYSHFPCCFHSVTLKVLT